MADLPKSYNLVRSFYGWIRKVEKDLKRERRQVSLPETYKTTIPGAYDFSQEVVKALAGTKHEERALYWQSTFESIVKEGWQDS